LVQVIKISKIDDPYGKLFCGKKRKRISEKGFERRLISL